MATLSQAHKPIQISTLFEIGIFEPDVEDPLDDLDFVKVYDLSVYREVDVFCQHVEDVTSVRGPETVRDNLHFCLRGAAIRWWACKLKINEKKAIRNDNTLWLSQWIGRLQNRFRAPAQAVFTPDLIVNDCYPAEDAGEVHTSIDDVVLPPQIDDCVDAPAQAVFEPDLIVDDCHHAGDVDNYHHAGEVFTSVDALASLDHTLKSMTVILILLAMSLNPLTMLSFLLVSFQTSLHSSTMRSFLLKSMTVILTLLAMSLHPSTSVNMPTRFVNMPRTFQTSLSTSVLLLASLDRASKSIVMPCASSFLILLATSLNPSTVFSLLLVPISSFRSSTSSILRAMSRILVSSISATSSSSSVLMSSTFATTSNIARASNVVSLHPSSVLMSTISATTPGVANVANVANDGKGPIYPVILALQTMGEPQHYHGHRPWLSPGQRISHLSHRHRHQHYRCYLPSSLSLDVAIAGRR